MGLFYDSFRESNNTLFDRNQLTSSNNIIRRQVEEPVEEVDTSSTFLERFLNTNQYVKVIGFLVVVVTQMSGSSEKQRNISLGLLAAILAVYAMEHWVMTRKVIVFGIALIFAKLLSLYLLFCVLKPEWLSWYGIVIVCIIATAYTCSNQLKTKFAWCCEKGVLVINYVTDKLLCLYLLLCKDQASPASSPPHASV